VPIVLGFDGQGRAIGKSASFRAVFANYDVMMGATVMSASLSSASLEPNSAHLGYLAPLVFFYGIGSARPQTEFVEPGELSEEARYLLVHESDMTPRLRDYHESPITLDVHGRGRVADYYVRAVVLKRERDARAVEFGAIGIHLQNLPEEAQRLVLEERVPFGALLEQLALPHSSHPRGYFRIIVDQRLAQLLDVQAGQTLFGRCNELRHANGSVLADVVEVLPS
jgi:chorismate-pyruvate lyase